MSPYVSRCHCTRTDISPYCSVGRRALPPALLNFAERRTMKRSIHWVIIVGAICLVALGGFGTTISPSIQQTMAKMRVHDTSPTMMPAPESGQRLFTIVNKLHQKIWVAAATSPGFPPTDTNGLGRSSRKEHRYSRAQWVERTNMGPYRLYV
jgi:hypothetical protein